MNVLFAGIGRSAPCWYRCALPARALGADWIGIRGDPRQLQIATGEYGRTLERFEDFASYDVVVLQQPRGDEWLAAICDLQARGTRVLFEIDDYAHGVGDAEHHAAAGAFDEPVLRAMEVAMRACDGIICSTNYIAARYQSFNPRTWVCANGLDLGRYALTRTPRAGAVTIGWAGGTGHRSALVPWLRELLEIMQARPQTRFMSVGVDFASALGERFGAQRCIALPFGPIETYPAAMTSFDIALAPATRSTFFRGKSDLRWLEASALGIPVVADPVVYPEIQDGVTGLYAANPRQARDAILALVDDAPLRARIGDAAQAHVREQRSIGAVAGQWALALDEVRGAARAA